MSAFDGMQPTRAQVVPYAPSLMITKLSVWRRTTASAASPAVPAPTCGDALGGRVEAATRREYGRAEVDVDRPGTLFAGLGNRQTVWMSHGDHVTQPPPGFTVLARTANGGAGRKPTVALPDLQHRAARSFG